jgi:hypothetical protein
MAMNRGNKGRRLSREKLPTHNGRGEKAGATLHCSRRRGDMARCCTEACGRGIGRAARSGPVRAWQLNGREEPDRPARPACKRLERDESAEPLERDESAREISRGLYARQVSLFFLNFEIYFLYLFRIHYSLINMF